MLTDHDGITKITRGDLPDCRECGDSTPAEYKADGVPVCGGCARQIAVLRKADARSSRRRYGRP